MAETCTVRGRVIRAHDLAPLANITVRLVTQAGYLSDAPHRTILPGGQIDWTGTLTDFAGTRWDCWEQHINGNVSIDWADFRDGALTYNPHLVSDERIFHEDKMYLVPEPAPIQEVAWSRQLSGFTGSRWDCWEQHIKDHVPIAWEEFRDNALLFNPQLQDDGRLFQPAKTYLVPDVVSTARAMIETTTAADGTYTFSNIGIGARAVLQIDAPGYTALRQLIVVNGDLEQPLRVSGGGSGVRSALPNYGALHPTVRAIIDQALSMLGDERSIFDSLPANLQALCYGAQFLNDPNSMYYKDIVCADLVSICFAAAGVPLNWAGPGGSNPHMAQYYAPGSSGVTEITDANDWQPGDVLVYGNPGAARAGHVTIYVGPFSGTDRSGKTYSLSAGNDVVEASMNFDMASGQRWGLGNIACTHQQCLNGKRGYQWVRRVRLNAVAALL